HLLLRPPAPDDQFRRNAARHPAPPGGPRTRLARRLQPAPAATARRSPLLARANAAAETDFPPSGSARPCPCATMILNRGVNSRRLYLRALSRAKAAWGPPIASCFILKAGISQTGL